MRGRFLHRGFLFHTDLTKRSSPPEGAKGNLTEARRFARACRLRRVFANSPSVYSERSLQRVASMASRAERGEHSALCDGVVGTHRVGAFQTKCGAETLRASLVTPSASLVPL